MHTAVLRPSSSPCAGLDGNRAPAPDHRPAARFIGLGDRALDQRLAWLDGWLRCEQQFLYRHWDTRLWSQAESSFSILVVHGEDAERLAQVLRDFRRIFPDKIMLAVLAQALPGARALTLRAGADAAFSTSSPAQVAAAWLATALARQAQTRAARRPGRHGGCTGGLERGFTPRERQILTVLQSNSHGTVDYRQIARAIERPLTPPCVRAIQATVCKLNKKIAGSARIRNVPGAGYRLTTANDTASSESRPAQAGSAARA